MDILNYLKNIFIEKFHDNVVLGTFIKHWYYLGGLFTTSYLKNALTV